MTWKSAADTDWLEQELKTDEHRFEISLVDSSMPPSGANWLLDNGLYKLSRRLRIFEAYERMPLISLALTLRSAVHGDERPEDEVMRRISQLPTYWAALEINSVIDPTSEPRWRIRANEDLPIAIVMQQQLTSYYKQYSCTRSSFKHVFSGKTITYSGRLDRLPSPWFTLPGLALFDVTSLHLQCEISRRGIEELELYSRVDPFGGPHSLLHLYVERLSGRSASMWQKRSTPHPLYDPNTISWRSRIDACQIQSMSINDGSAASQVHCQNLSACQARYGPLLVHWV